VWGGHRGRAAAMEVIWPGRFELLAGSALTQGQALYPRSSLTDGNSPIKASCPIRASPTSRCTSRVSHRISSLADFGASCGLRRNRG
jgi:hypothetical protein